MPPRMPFRLSSLSTLRRDETGGAGEEDVVEPRLLGRSECVGRTARRVLFERGGKVTDDAQRFLLGEDFGFLQVRR